MTMTREASKWHEAYEEVDESVQIVVNTAYMAARNVIEASGMCAANDDRAEKLVAAIMEYITESAG